MSASLPVAKPKDTRLAFAGCLVGFTALALGLTAVAPLAMSIGIVFLFAGPHNYVEARYFLTRLPARMGKLRGFFFFSAAGVVGLTVALPLISRLTVWLNWSASSALGLIGIWNTALILWCTTLIWLRSKQPPRFRADYIWPLGIGLIGLSWIQPILLPIALVFLHPLMGLWVLDREISKRRSDWLATYRGCLLLVPCGVAVLWLVEPSAASFSGWLEFSPGVTAQVSSHAGTHLLTGLNPNKLIATHAFLELLHYGVWMLAVPAASGRVFAEGFKSIPVMKRSKQTRRLIGWGLLLSAAAVATLWFCFAADYETTRDVYFMIATLHVLAEVPFLLRLF